MFDNLRPLDYPKFTPAEFLGDEIVVVDKGDYVVDKYGDLLKITHGNKEYVKSDKVYDHVINAHYYRARYLGNRDDSLGYANQIRLATDEEVKRIKEWLASGVRYKQTSSGQLSMI